MKIPINLRELFCLNCSRCLANFELMSTGDFLNVIVGDFKVGENDSERFFLV